MAASELTQRCWTIAEELGKPVSESQKVYQAICDEMMGVPIARHHALAIAAYVGSWKATRNPYYIDLAFMMLSSLGGQPTETMLQEDLAARTARFYGSPSGTAENIQNEGAEWAALLFMANLVIRGATCAEASRKAASFYSLRYPHLKRKKASTLEGYYSKRVRKSGLEQDLIRSMERDRQPDWDRQWQEISDAIPACPPDLVGNARF